MSMNMSKSVDLSQNIDTLIAEDLLKSGLTLEDMSIRDLDSPERAATHTPFSALGYVIPYYDILERVVPFYRVKIINPQDKVKYKQPEGTPNHIYFPKGFKDLLTESSYIMITEGEKKAAKAVKEGFPCVAIGGVDSWRNRVLHLPSNVEMSGDKEKVTAKLPSGLELLEDTLSPLASGLQDLIDHAVQYDKDIIIVYDTDEFGIKPGVQRAAAAFGFELRFRGVPYRHIKQLRLPHRPGFKTGLDDFLCLNGCDPLRTLIQQVQEERSAFPKHPTIVDFVNKRLQRSKMSRKEVQQISLAILSDLDTGGLRLNNQTSAQPYYFDYKTHKLIKVSFNQFADVSMADTFYQHLYKTYGISTADGRVMLWLGTQFAGEQPIEEVTPHRILARPDKMADSVTFQLSDGAYAVIDGSTDNPELPGLRIYNNGENKILFESGHSEPLDVKLLVREYAKRAKEPVKCWWADVLSDVRLKDKDKQRYLLALFYYISPWLYRWRNMQLPIELVLGEAGSGKSTLCELRLNILSGSPKLRNAPTDLKDWYASITNSGGTHIIDNLQFADKGLQQRISDELCRIVTAPNPTVEARRLYSNAELVQIPVHCCFGFTAIRQPFLNSDILQRSIITELDKANDIVDGELSYDSDWMTHQLNRFGGREAWVAHHLYILHQFFKAVKVHWNSRYMAKHRLINYEQSLRIMAKVLGIPDEWIPDYISFAAVKAVSENDWAFNGLMECTDWFRKKDPNRQYITSYDIANWAAGQEDFEKCEILTNARKLGRYMKSHKASIATVIGLYEAGLLNNRIRYQIKHLKRNKDG